MYMYVCICMYVYVCVCVCAGGMLGCLVILAVAYVLHLKTQQNPLPLKTPQNHAPNGARPLLKDTKRLPTNTRAHLLKDPLTRNPACLLEDKQPTSHIPSEATRLFPAPADQPQAVHLIQVVPQGQADDARHVAWLEESSKELVDNLLTMDAAQDTLSQLLASATVFKTQGLVVRYVCLCFVFCF